MKRWFMLGASILLVMGLVLLIPASAQAATPPLRLYVTDCSTGTALDNATVQFTILRGGQQVGSSITLYTDDGRVVFTPGVAIQEDDVCRVVFAPAANGDPCSVDFVWNHVGREEFDWRPGTDPKFDSCPTVAIEIDGVEYWNVKYH
jgi:hypothetical protein